MRRDLTALERPGLLRRVHGGAIPVERLGAERAVADREERLAGQKERIAKVALDELPDGGSIIIDAGAATAHFARLLPTDRELMVVTHSLPTANLLVTWPNTTLYLLGGVVRPRTLAAVGDWTRHNLADAFVTALFIKTGWLPSGILGGFGNADLIGWQGAATQLSLAPDRTTFPQYVGLVGPMITYLLPLLTANAGGRIVYKERGGVIACVATMGVIAAATFPCSWAPCSSGRQPPG